MAQRDYFLTIQNPEGLRTVPTHADCALEVLTLWTDAVRTLQGANAARSVSCHSTLAGNPATKQIHWEITLYSPGLF